MYKKKISLIVILIVSSIWSCHSDRNNSTVANQEIENEVRLVPSPPKEYYTDFEDEECHRQMDSAKIDAQEGRLIFQNSFWKNTRANDEIEELLEAYDIAYLGLGSNCTLEQQCYGYFMDSTIRQKFGESFLDQIARKADSLFLARWETKVYSFYDIDEAPLFPNENVETYIEQKGFLIKIMRPR